MKKILLPFLLPVISTFAQNLQISGGNAHSVAICESGDIYAWGKNDAGQLGPSGGAGGPTPVLVTGFPAGLDIKQTDAGSGSHTLALGCDGKVYAWGTNATGQLGNGSVSVSQATPVAVKGVGCIGDLTGVKYVSGGNDESFAIMSDGRVVSWGQNDKGQLGQNKPVTTATVLCPDYVKKCSGGDLTNVVQVEAGDENGYALLADGTVWSWGENSSGNGLALGRGTAGTNTIATNNTCAAQMQYANPANIANFSATLVTNIKSISAGDRHLLLLDNDGYVWSTGGDWGPGQLGTGTGYQSPAGIAHVLAPGDPRCTTANNNDNQGAMTNANFFGNVIGISGLQAASIAITADGKAWAWGANGFYDACATGTSLAGGQLGNGTSGGASATTCGTPVGSECPAAVYKSAGVPLTGIASVSDGDAVSFFIGEDGTVYTAGSGRYGQVGSATNQNYAVSLPSLNSLPCNVAIPVAPTPNLGADVSKNCLSEKVLLRSQVTQLTPYNFIWEYSSTSATGPWVPLVNGDGTQTYNSIPTTQNADTTYVTDFGWYKITITDDRSALAANCSPPGTVSDVIKISENPNPYTTSGCWDAAGNIGEFKVTVPANSKIKWYTASSGGTALNPSDSLATFTGATATQAPVSTLCGSGVHALYADDLTSKQGILMPATSVATAQTQTGCSTLQDDYDSNGDRFLTRITLSQTAKLTSASFIHNANAGNASIKIYNDNAGSRGTLVYTSPTVAVAGTGSLIYDIPMSTTLTAGSYWIATSSGGQLKRFNCNFGASIGDNLTPDIIVADKGITDGNNTTGKGTVFNLKFETGTGYTCGRILVCATGACTLPLKFLSFDAEKKSSSTVLTWMVADEDNVSSYSVMKSYDGINFSKIGSVGIAQNNSAYNTYSFNDVNTEKSGTVYYKIVEVDVRGGTSSSSNVISVNLKDYNNALTVVPNPNSGSFKVSLNKEVDYMFISITDLRGREVYAQQVNSASESLQVNIGKGVYLVRVSDGSDTWIEKIVIE
ncbi:MAG: T9SS type A sorting domain-containing protein [Cytophagales bacterium]